MKVKELFNMLNSMMLKGLDSDADIYIETSSEVETMQSASVVDNWTAYTFDDYETFRNAEQVIASHKSMRGKKIVVLSVYA